MSGTRTHINLVRKIEMHDCYIKHARHANMNLQDPQVCLISACLFGHTVVQQLCVFGQYKLYNRYVCSVNTVVQQVCVFGQNSLQRA